MLAVVPCLLGMYTSVKPEGRGGGYIEDPQARPRVVLSLRATKSCRSCALSGTSHKGRISGSCWTS